MNGVGMVNKEVAKAAMQIPMMVKIHGILIWIMAVTLARIGITMMDTVTSGVFSRITELIL